MLHKIREELHSAFKKTTKESEQMSSKIKQYQSIGMGFDELAKEYASIVEQIESTRWQMKELGGNDGK